MAEDFDVEAMLEAPYRKDESSKHHRSSEKDKHRSDRDRDRERNKDRDRRRSRSKERKRSRSRDHDRKRSRDRGRSRDKGRSRDRDRSKEKERPSHRSRDRSRDRKRPRDDERKKSRSPRPPLPPPPIRQSSKDRDGGDYRKKGKISLEAKLEELAPEERDLRTVFCMQLSQRIRAKDLEEFFSSVGKVRDVRLITCNKTRRFKGIAYIEFKDAESVPLALGLTGQKVLGVPIIVQHTQAEKNRMGNTMPNLAPKNANGPTRLYVGSLHFNITEEMLRGIFEPFGKIDSIQLITDPETGKSKGYGFITYHNASDAKKAMEQLNGFELAGRPMKVGNVTERAGEITSNSRFDADELDRAGVDLGATGRLQLMFKLAEGSGLQVPQATASLLMPNIAQPSVTPSIATQCFMLNNMFEPNMESNPNWDIEIRDDVISECNKHGGVLHVYVDKASPAGHVYVKCPTIATAVASVNTLHGRWFAGRVITAAYVPLVNYHSLFPDAITALSLLLPSSARQGQDRF